MNRGGRAGRSMDRRRCMRRWRLAEGAAGCTVKANAMNTN